MSVFMTFTPSKFAKSRALVLYICSWPFPTVLIYLPHIPGSHKRARGGMHQPEKYSRKIISAGAHLPGSFSNSENKCLEGVSPFTCMLIFSFEPLKCCVHCTHEESDVGKGPRSPAKQGLRQKRHTGLGMVPTTLHLSLPH